MITLMISLMISIMMRITRLSQESVLHGQTSVTPVELLAGVLSGGISWI